MNATIDKQDATAEDVVFLVGSNVSNEITGLKIGASDVNVANYTVVGLELAIDATYLKGLAVGEKTFTILMARGGDLIVTVAVTDL